MSHGLKRWTVCGLIPIFLFVLSACGAAGPDTATTARPSVSPAAEAGSEDGHELQTTEQAAAATRTVATAKGDIEVPAEPKRVIALYMIGEALSLGIVPVGISDVYEGAAFWEEASGVPMLGSWFEPNVEQIIELEPDLILVPSEETYELMRKIAPTVLINAFDQTPEETIVQLGDVLGKSEEAARVLAEFTAKVDDSKRKLADAGLLDKTVTIVEGGKGGMTVVSSANFGRASQAVYHYLGLKAPEPVQQEIDRIAANGETAAALELSFEVLGDYIGDFVFRSSYENMVDLSDNTIWNAIPAVKEGRLIHIPFGFAYYSDLYSIEKHLDFVVDSMVEAPR